MTNQEIKEARKQYKDFLNIRTKMLELETLINNSNLEGKYGLPDKDSFSKLLSDYDVLRKIYLSFETKQKFNIKVYMGSYIIYDGRDSNDCGYEDDLLVFNDDPNEQYKVFWDIESNFFDKQFYSCPNEIFFKSELESNYKNYQENNILIFVPNDEIITSIKEASKYTIEERYFSYRMNSNVKYNKKRNVDNMGTFKSIQNEFFNLLVEYEPEDAIKKLVKKYEQYNNYYDYDKNR